MSSPEECPDLVLGDANDWVIDLQLRLNTVGVYPDYCDGILGERTAVAVRDFSLAYQVVPDHDVVVGRRVWTALLSLTSSAEPTFDAGGAPAEGQLSDDQTWVWHDGTWYPAGGFDVDPRPDQEVITESDQVGPISEDGHWRWVDNRWQPNA